MAHFLAVTGAFLHWFIFASPENLFAAMGRGAIGPQDMSRFAPKMSSAIKLRSQILLTVFYNSDVQNPVPLFKNLGTRGDAAWRYRT
jgi:hypothetical protein